jgi:predicted AlkP superfamily pyrophosphatase or phosphodiesterase
MKRHQASYTERALSLFFGLAVASCGNATCPPAAAPGVAAKLEPKGPVKHVLLISLDGLMPDSYLNPDMHRLSVPTLRWMVAHGAFSDGVKSVFPTVTYPSHTAMVTGVNPGRHGIVSNRTFDPLETDLESWLWYSETLTSDPIWRLTAQRGYVTAMIHWPVTVGAKVDWLLPEYWRARTKGDQALMRAISTPGLLEGVAKEHPDFWERYIPPDVSDDTLTDIALYVLSHAKPTLFMLHLVGVDGAQHRYGVDSAEARAAIEMDDRQLARIYEAVHRLGMANDTMFVVVSDHGFRNVDKAVRPCVLLREAGLVEVNDAAKVTRWKAAVNSNSGSAYVYVNEAADPQTRDLVRKAFSAQVAKADSGIARLYEAGEIQARGGDPKAFIAIEAGVGYQLLPGCAGEYVATPSYHGTHGYDPEHPELHASLLVQGPNVLPGRIANARLIDIAPTIAKWFGIPMPNVEGTPLQIPVTAPKQALVH